jgi:hypothetical protein
MVRRYPVIGILIVFAFVWGATTWVTAQEKPLDNAELVKLTKAEMGDDVIIAKIKSAKEVAFATGTDDLVKLREAGVSKAVITAMLDRVAAIAAMLDRAAAAAKARPSGEGTGVGQVKVKATDGTIELASMVGLKEQGAVPFRGLVGWIKYDGTKATPRTKDRRPSIEMQTDGDPVKGGWFFVSLEQNGSAKDGYRSFDLKTQTGAWSSTLTSAPDPGTVIAVDCVEASPGLWKLTPQKPLKPGEYGLYYRVSEKQIMYGFGIDK